MSGGAMYTSESGSLVGVSAVANVARKTHSTSNCFTQLFSGRVKKARSVCAKKAAQRLTQKARSASDSVAVKQILVSTYTLAYNESVLT